MTLLALTGAAAVALAFGLDWYRRRPPPPPPPPSDPFLALTVHDPKVADAALARIAAEWRPESPALVFEVLPFVSNETLGRRLYDLLRAKTGQQLPDDHKAWLRWMWAQPPPDARAVFRFRAALYEHVATGRAEFATLAEYFRGDPPAAVRADEIRWGGVTRDGIPPVRDPKLVPAGSAAYLADTDTVFGLRINGAARAYPTRILGRHEMVCDTVGGVPVTGVYCTLCEAMIAYDSRTADGTVHRFGTSGFLFRSNKLMYDAGTRSLWNTNTGRPVVGALVGKGLELAPHPVVTTTWGEWRARHPDTSVLALDGLPRFPGVDPGDVDYSEGAAYAGYRATDALMFPVPHPDARLKNKDEVFVPRVAGEHRPVAVAVKVLAENPVYHLEVGAARLVVLSTPGGANRAYAAGDRTFRAPLRGDTVSDADGTAWHITEEHLRAPDGRTLARVPAHRVYWFGWHAARPDTLLVK